MANQQTINRVNGIDLDVLLNTINAIEQNPELAKCKFRAKNTWITGTQSKTTIKDFYGAGQEMEHVQEFEVGADEPLILAGQDQYPNAAEHLLNSLATCLATGIVAHAAVRGIHIEQLEAELEGDIDIRGFLGLSNDVPKGFTNITVKFKVKSDVDDLKKIEKLIEFSPVLATLTQGVNVDIKLEPK